MEIQKRIEQFKRKEIARLLPKLPQDQQDFFWKLFSNRAVPEGKLVMAIELIERSLDKLGIPKDCPLSDVPEKMPEEPEPSNLTCRCGSPMQKVEPGVWKCSNRDCIEALPAA